MNSLPPSAVDHLYPVMVLLGALGAAGVALIGLIWRGRAELEKIMRRTLTAAYGPDDRGAPGVAARMTSDIVQRAFSDAINPLLSAVQAVDRKQQELSRSLKEHEDREFLRQQAAADSLKAELRADLSKLVEQATRFPAAVFQKAERVEAVLLEQGKRIDSHEERILRLEAGGE